MYKHVYKLKSKVMNKWRHLTMDTIFDNIIIDMLRFLGLTIGVAILVFIAIVLFIIILSGLLYILYIACYMLYSDISDLSRMLHNACLIWLSN